MSVSFLAPHNPWTTNPTLAQLESGRTASTVFGALGLSALIFLVALVEPSVAPIAGIFVMSSAGFLNQSITAFLDIFVAVFCTLSLISLYFYIVKRSSKTLYVSAIFLGLAFGSKTSWDPIVLATIIIAGIFIVEEKNRSRIIQLAKSIFFAVVSFAATSTVVVLRLSDQIHATINGAGGNFNFQNLLNSQSILSPGSYSIFYYQTGANIALYSLVVILFLSLIIYKWYNTKSEWRFNLQLLFKKFRDNRLLVFAVLVLTFCSIDLIMTGSSFEYGRNYARAGIYEALAVFTVFAFVKSSFPTRRSLLNRTFLLLGFVLAVFDWSYWALLPAQIAQNGSVLISKSLLSIYVSGAGILMLVGAIACIVLFVPTIIGSIVSGIAYVGAPKIPTLHISIGRGSTSTPLLKSTAEVLAKTQLTPSSQTNNFDNFLMLIEKAKLSRNAEDLLSALNAYSKVQMAVGTTIDQSIDSLNLVNSDRRDLKQKLDSLIYSKAKNCQLPDRLFDACLAALYDRAKH